MTVQTTLSNVFPIFRTHEDINVVEETTPRSVNRIVVLLDGSAVAERAIPVALELAQAHEGTVTVICRSTDAHAQSYAEAKAHDLRQQGINAHGYAADLSAGWLVQSEVADVVVLAQQSVGRLGRWLGADLAATLRTRTDAEVVAVAV